MVHSLLVMLSLLVVFPFDWEGSLTDDTLLSTFIGGEKGLYEFKYSDGAEGWYVFWYIEIATNSVCCCSRKLGQLRSVIRKPSALRNS